MDAGGGGRLAKAPDRGGEGVVAAEGEAAGDRLEEHDAEGVDVDRGGGLAPFDLLRRQVLRGAEDAPIGGEGGTERGR